MRLKFGILLVFVCTIFSACSEVNRAALKETNILPPAKGWGQQAAAPRAVLPEVKPKRLALPVRVAVHLSEPDQKEFHWTARDRGRMAAWGRTLRAEGIVKELSVMSKLVSTGNSLNEIRRAAKLHGADVVMVIKSSGEIDESWNPLAVFYITLVGYYIIPGSSAEAAIAVNAVVLDVDSGAPLFTLESDGRKSSLAPGGWLDTQELIAKAKSKARDAMGREFIKGMRELAVTLKTLPKRPRVVIPKVRQHRLSVPKPKVKRKRIRKIYRAPSGS